MAPLTFFIFAVGCARYEQRRFFLLLYIRHRLSIHYSQSKPKASAPPPSAPFPQPARRSDVEFRIDLLASQVSTLPALFLSQLDAPQALFVQVPAPLAPCPARLVLDARSPILLRLLVTPRSFRFWEAWAGSLRSHLPSMLVRL